ncbi:hypothetical protein SRHO_G00208470 [Serrasalmus rhombeus]
MTLCVCAPDWEAWVSGGFRAAEDSDHCNLHHGRGRGSSPRGRPQGPIELCESSIVSELKQAVSEFLDKGFTLPGLPEEEAGLGGQWHARTLVTWSFGPAGPVHLLVGS